MRAAALSVCDYITHFVALFSNYQSQSTQAPIKQITMNPHHVTVFSDDNVVTGGTMFENPLFIFFLKREEVSNAYSRTAPEDPLLFSGVEPAWIGSDNWKIKQ